MSVNQKILDAIELLTKSSVQQAGYDKTIQAQILSCEDAALGKYRCKFQDSVFYAYTNSSDVSYSKGTLVYILVPQNDMRKQKTIIGTVQRLGTNYISMAIGEQAYNKVGTNCITSNDKYYLYTKYNNYSYDVYKKNRTDGKPNINLDTTALSTYLKQSSSIIVGATIKTQIPEQRQGGGSYGIIFGLKFNDGNVREYILDENKMVDNPYQLLYDTRQYAIFDIDGENFDSIEYITIFNKDFPNSISGSPDENEVKDIILSSFEIVGANRMTQAQLGGLAINFYTPKGTLFINSSDDNKILTAQIKVKGKLISSTKGIQFYWGQQDVSVTAASEFYNRYLGRGWKCLNILSVSQTGDDTDPIKSWLPSVDTKQIQFQDATAYDNKFKVAAIYDGNVLTKEINIRNLTKDSDIITITSSAGTRFYYGLGQTNLVCTVKNTYVPSGTLTYYWAWQNYENILQPYLEASGNQILNFDVRQIFNFAKFKCTVYDIINSSTKNLVGTSSITLTNSLEGEGFNSLVLNNRTIVFKYDTNGISPTKRLQNPQLISPLDFILYNEAGEPIIYNENGLINLSNSNVEIKWGFPKENTLLKNNQVGQPVSTDDRYNYYSNLSSFSYGIADRYDISKQNNQIILIVAYEGRTYRAETNFTFIKQGDPGTNGTEYFIKLIPNTLMTNPPRYPIITQLGTNGNYEVNYGIGTSSSSSIITNNNSISQRLLKAQLWKNDTLLWQGFGNSELDNLYEISDDQNQTIDPIDIQWDILANVYTNSAKDYSDFEVDDNNNLDGGKGFFTIISDFNDINQNKTRANIIKCTITYEEKKYIGILPIIVAWTSSSSNTSRIRFKQNTGFMNVLYGADGANPQYNTRDPFVFEVYNENTVTNTYSLEDIDVNGDTKYKSSGSWTSINSENLIKRQLTIDGTSSLIIKPSQRYDGFCLNNAVIYNGTNYKIHVPIYFSLNKYGLDRLNDWDGNSIKISDDDGYILTPQIGAGTKNQYNNFTGMLMGEVKYPSQNYSKIGLLGYYQGQQTLFLNSQNGSALFGRTGKGQIVIDPADSGGKALLYSSNYWSNYNAQTGLPTSYSSGNEAHTGLLIDLTTPQIKYGNGNFSVDSSGNLTASNADITGAITATSLTLGANTTITDNSGYFSGCIRTDGSVGSTTIRVWTSGAEYSQNQYVQYNGNIYKCKLAHTASNSNKPDDATYGETYWESQIPNSSYFLVSNDGLLTANNAVILGTIYSTAGQVGGWTIGQHNLSTGSPGSDNINGGIGLYSSTSPSISINGSGANTNWSIIAGKTFGVTKTGDLYASNAYITGNITANTGKIGGSSGWAIGSGYIASNSKTSFGDSTHAGIYIGTNGIDVYNSSLTKTFEIDSNGNVSINGNLSLSQNSVISFSGNTSTTIGTVASNANTAISNANTASNNVAALANGTYSGGTFISNKEIQSPTISGGSIIGGEFHATGQGKNYGISGTDQAAYYIHSGKSSSTLGALIGYISFDTQGTAPNITNRVIFKTKSFGSGSYAGDWYIPSGSTDQDVALKLESSASMSLEAGVDSSEPNEMSYKIFLASTTRISKNLELQLLARYGDSISGYRWMGGYGYDLPPLQNVSYGGYTESVGPFTGQVFFKLDNNS